jgi:hypothetical protein
MRAAADRREILLGLAALEYVATCLGDPPMPSSLNVRAILALLYARSNGDRRCYDEFWQICRREMKGEYGDAYIRASTARTATYGIARSLGVEPRQIEVSDAIGRIVDLHRRAVDPEYRKNAAITDGFRNAKWDREIIATKGHPYSATARRMVAERIARGEPVDGKG